MSAITTSPLLQCKLQNEQLALQNFFSYLISQIFQFVICNFFSNSMINSKYKLKNAKYFYLKTLNC